MELEECPSSANRWRHKSFLNPTDSEWPNGYQFDELQLAMEILDMELRADKLKWHQESEVSVGRARGFVVRFKCCLMKLKYWGRPEIGWEVIRICIGLQYRNKS